MKAFFVIAALCSAPAAAQVAADCGSVRILASDLREGYESAYGKSFRELEQEWRAALKGEHK